MIINLGNARPQFNLEYVPCTPDYTVLYNGDAQKLNNNILKHKEFKEPKLMMLNANRKQIVQQVLLNKSSKVA